MVANNDEIKEVYQRRVPAPQTLDFMQKITTEIALMKKDVQNICEKLDENSKEHRIMFDKIDKFIEGADEKYTKYTEFTFWRTILVSGILITIFTGVLFIILQGRL